MDKIENYKLRVLKILENETDRFVVNQILEVIEEAFALGLQEGMKVNWQEHDN